MGTLESTIKNEYKLSCFSLRNYRLFHFLFNPKIETFSDQVLREFLQCQVSQEGGEDFLKYVGGGV